MNRSGPLPLIGRSPRRTAPRPLAWLALIVVLVVFACGVAWNIHLPGLYMDAVNPDYIAVRVLGHERFPLPIWVLPGNLIVDRFPIMTSLYHGTLHVWAGLPVFALFGIGIESLRAAQALFGAAILVGVFALLRRADRSRRALLVSALVVLALALDPVFVFAFRTQLYITLAPTAFVLAAVLFGHAALRPRDDGAARWLVLLAGVAYGLAAFGYFVHAFFAPALLLALIVRSRQVRLAACGLGIWTLLLWLGAGLAIGGGGYLIGYGRIADATGGPTGLLEYLSSTQQSLGAFESKFTLAQTFDYFAALVSNVFSNAWQHALMFGEGTPQSAWLAKFVVLLGLPVLLWLVAELTGRPSRWLRLVLALMLSFAIVAAGFGSRVSGHHFATLVPLSYAALGLGLIALVANTRSRWPLLLAGLLLAGVAAINTTGQWQTQEKLVETGGRKLFSDAINRFAADALASRRDQLVVLPDWGLFMPFQFLTDGQVEHLVDVDLARMRSALCSGREVAVALINDDVDARLQTLADQLPWSAASRLDYLDREGARVFAVLTLAADGGRRGAADCTAASQAPTESGERLGARSVALPWRSTRPAHRPRWKTAVRQPAAP